MTGRLLLICALVLAGSSVAAAERDATSVDEIVARHIEARGGAEKLRALETVVYSNGLYSEADYTGSGNAFMAFKRPYHRVVGNPVAPGGYMEGWDESAWEWLADPGIVVRTVGAASAASRHGAHLAGPFLDYRAKGTRIELGDPEEIDGRPAYHLIVTLRDGFQKEYFIDQESFLVTAERMTAPFHAFGDPVTSETRVGDYREAASVLFPHSFVETVIATGEPLTQMQWGKVEANRELPTSWFSPPVFERTSLQAFLEALYGERADRSAVMWSYTDFRRARPEIDTREGIETIGYQMLKMGDFDAAIALLEANARDYPDSSTSAFGLGRAYETADQRARARRQYERALELDPGNGRAERALASLVADLGQPGNPLSFLEPFIGSWKMDPESDFVKSDPSRADFVAFRFEWADPQRKILRFYEGIPDGDLDTRILEKLVTFNPRTEEVVALGYQLHNDFLYESTFQPQSDGFIRDYKVTYPPEQQFRNEQDRERGWIHYRDRCTLESPDRLHCVTEQMRDEEWQPWGDPDGYAVVRR